MTNALEKWVFPIFGLPTILHSDNGRENVNPLIEDVLATLPGAVQLVSGLLRHSQSQGLVEQAHYTLERMMSSRIAESASNSPPWTHWLPHIVYMFCLANVYKHVDALYSVYSYNYDYADTINAGFQSTILSFKFQMKPKRTPFIQILNINNNHWITISTIGVPCQSV